MRDRVYFKIKIIYNSLFEVLFDTLVIFLYNKWFILNIRYTNKIKKICLEIILSTYPVKLTNIGHFHTIKFSIFTHTNKIVYNFLSQNPFF